MYLTLHLVIALQKCFLYDLDSTPFPAVNMKPAVVDKGLYKYLKVDIDIDWFSLTVGSTASCRTCAAWLVAYEE